MFAACRTILQQCVTDVTGLDSLVVGGRWSKNALPQEWLKFLEIGAKGKVISWKVRVACPEILVIISEALNNANDTNKIPSEAEFVKKMMGKALEQQRKFPGVQPDWAYIKRASFGGKAGTLAAKADDMMLFVAGCGGKDGGHIYDFAQFHAKRHPNMGIPKEVYIMVTQQMYPKAPLVAMAVLKALLQVSHITHKRTGQVGPLIASELSAQALAKPFSKIGTGLANKDADAVSVQFVNKLLDNARTNLTSMLARAKIPADFGNVSGLNTDIPPRYPTGQPDPEKGGTTHGFQGVHGCTRLRSLDGQPPIKD